MRISRALILLSFILLWKDLNAQDVFKEEIESIRANTISFDKKIEEISISDFKRLNFSNDIKVFGLGEANHGTREFQVLKLKLAEYLIQEKGLNAIMIEFPYSQGLLIDGYVKGNNSDGLTILTNQKNSEYKNTDFINLIESIKRLNESRSQNDKISFLGGDIFGKPTAIRLLKDYFNKVDSSQLMIFTPYKDQEAKIYLSAFEQDKKEFTALSKKTSRILKKHRIEYIQKTSVGDYNQAVRLAESLGLKWKGNVRAKSFAHNVMRTLSESPNNKVLVISHNLHIGMLNKDVGRFLRKKLNDKYLSIGTDFEEGTFSLWNLKDANNRFVDTLYTPKFKNGFADKFSDIEGAFYYISLTQLRKVYPAIATTDNYIASIGMGFNKDLVAADFRKKVNLTKDFDSMFIFKIIHPIKRWE
jgi:erythromycin esterase